MAALAIGLGGAVGELWVQDALLLLLALALCGVSGYRLYQKNNGQKQLKAATDADEERSHLLLALVTASLMLIRV
jgi:hypothetical protein